jgi:hypothetical protein
LLIPFDQGFLRHYQKPSTPWPREAAAPRGRAQSSRARLAFPAPRTLIPLPRKVEPTLRPSSVVSLGVLASMIAGSNPECPTGVVGSIVPLTILAVVAFLFTRHRRQQQIQPQLMPNPDEDPYKQRPVSYGPPMTSPHMPSFTPYVRLMRSALGTFVHLFTFLIVLEPIRSNDVPSCESARLGDIHHPTQQHPWNLFWDAGAVIALSLFRFRSFSFFLCIFGD